MISTDKSQYVAGETVLISGNVRDAQGNPVFGASISIQVNDPANNLFYVQLALASQSGGYSDHFTLPINAVLGLYTINVTASQTGYADGNSQAKFSVSAATASTSSSTSSSGTSSTVSKCLIVTATYGSELAPEVALLRNFRDLDILRTSAGESFMLVFNAFYYSFSPGAASYIASHTYVKAAMKIVLYPLIGTFYLSKFVFDALSLNGEIAAVTSGVVASLALGAIYVGPLLTVISRLSGSRTASRYARSLRLASLIGSSAIAGLILAELGKSVLLLEITTVGTVLSNIALGGLIFSWTITRALSRERF
jgi:hypothetical protein